MKPNSKRAVTLIEILISICLLGMVIIGLYSIDLFSRRQFLSTDKKSKVQNEAVYVLSHINKNLMMAIGDTGSNPAVTIVNTTGLTINATIDSNHNGLRDDGTVLYCFNNTTCGNSNGTYAIYFKSSAPASPEKLASHVKSFNAWQIGSCVNVDISTCWDPSQTSQACGSLDNPAFNLTNSVRMLSVSTH